MSGCPEFPPCRWGVRFSEIRPGKRSQHSIGHAFPVPITDSGENASKMMARRTVALATALAFLAALCPTGVDARYRSVPDPQPAKGHGSRVVITVASSFVASNPRVGLSTLTARRGTVSRRCITQTGSGSGRGPGNPSLPLGASMQLFRLNRGDRDHLQLTHLFPFNFGLKLRAGGALNERNPAGVPEQYPAGDPGYAAAVPGPVLELRAVLRGRLHAVNVYLHVAWHDQCHQPRRLRYHSLAITRPRAPYISHAHARGSCAAPNQGCVQADADPVGGNPGMMGGLLRRSRFAKLRSLGSPLRALPFS